MDTAEMRRQAVVLLGEVEEAATSLSLEAGAHLEELTEGQLADLLTAAVVILIRLRGLRAMLPAESDSRAG